MYTIYSQIFLFTSSNPHYAHLYLILCLLLFDICEWPCWLPCAIVGLGQWKTESGDWRERKERFVYVIHQLHPSVVTLVSLPSKVLNSYPCGILAKVLGSEL